MSAAHGPDHTWSPSQHEPFQKSNVIAFGDGDDFVESFGLIQRSSAILRSKTYSKFRNLIQGGS